MLCYTLTYIFIQQSSYCYQIAAPCTIFLAVNLEVVYRCSYEGRLVLGLCVSSPMTSAYIYYLNKLRVICCVREA